MCLLIKDSSLQKSAKWSILRRWKGKKDPSCTKLKPRDIMLENIWLLLICARYWRLEHQIETVVLPLTSPCSSSTFLNVFPLAFLNPSLSAHKIFVSRGQLLLLLYCLHVLAWTRHMQTAHLKVHLGDVVLNCFLKCKVLLQRAPRQLRSLQTFRKKVSSISPLPVKGIGLCSSSTLVSLSMSTLFFPPQF